MTIAQRISRAVPIALATHAATATFAMIFAYSALSRDSRITQTEATQHGPLSAFLQMAFSPVNGVAKSRPDVWLTCGIAAALFATPLFVPAMASALSARGPVTFHMRRAVAVYAKAALVWSICAAASVVSCAVALFCAYALHIAIRDMVNDRAHDLLCVSIALPGLLCAVLAWLIRDASTIRLITAPEDPPVSGMRATSQRITCRQATTFLASCGLIGAMRLLGLLLATRTLAEHFGPWWLAAAFHALALATTFVRVAWLASLSADAPPQPMLI